MAPTILVIGATGNTGKGVVYTLSKLLASKNNNYRILGLTRSLNNSTSQKLAKLPLVEMQEKDWTTIDANWLKEQEVVKAYVAPHALPEQFVDESALYVAMLQAGVKYVVKLSTTSSNVSPSSQIFYGRAHWAVESQLSQPEFKSLQWTSLQANLFTTFIIGPIADWIKQYQNTGTQGVLKTVLAADGPVGVIDPEEVGKIGAHLLALDDPTPHNQARYILNGPEDITGRRLVETVEQYAGIKVQDVEYKDESWIKHLGTAGGHLEKYLPPISVSFKPLWQGVNSLSATPTSKEIIELSPPKHTVADVLKAIMEA
ncbi:hypothetical protein G6F37_011538 [Rhizopus arrhizus]|nr:hypothetical protein G6F38_011630 [Rhizopus arrhizus]KAG1148823.1 hypothetical protein G6F37_011538 [Rhizopus arrhizus]